MMDCKNCGWHKVVCDSCHGACGLRGWLNFSEEELKDLSMNLKQCESEGYLKYGDFAYDALQQINNELEKIQNLRNDGMDQR